MNTTDQHTTPHQRIVPRISLQTDDHGIVGAARFYTEAFRPLEEAGLDLGSAGLGDSEGVGVGIAGLHLQLVDAADEPGSGAVTPATNITVNIDPVFFGWAAEGDSPGDAEAREAAVSRARAALDTIWDGLVDGGGAVLMPLDSYPFSDRYSWVVDRFGLSWQLMLTDPSGDPRPALIPSFMFCGAAQNMAGEAVDQWTAEFADVFGDGPESTGVGTRVRYGQPTGPTRPESVVFSDARLAGSWITAMDSGVEQPFSFSDAVTFQVHCDTPVQAEVLRRRLGLAEDGTDRYGVRWSPQSGAQRSGSGEAR